MFSPLSVVAATLLQLCGVFLFIRHPQQDTQCLLTRLLGKWMFGASLLLLLWRWELVPKRIDCIYPRIYTCLELLCSVFVSELALLIGWCSYERLIYQLSHLLSLTLNMHCRWCDILTLSMLTLLPSVLLLLTLTPAQWREFLVQLLWQLPRPEADERLLSFMGELPDYVKRLLLFCQLKQEDRPRSTRLIRL